MRIQVSRNQFIHGTVWKVIETFMSVGVSFVVSLLLARLLTPNDFGVIALSNVFINFSEILLQSAFSAPLIQKENIDDVDYTSVLTFSLLISLVLYFIVFAFAPAFSSLYNQERITGVLRVISLSFIFQAFGSVRTAIVSRQMRFKMLSIYTVIASVLSGIAGIVFAMLGYGVWALVIQKLFYQVVLNVVLFIAIKWKPTFKGLSFGRVKELLSFGSKVLGSSFVSYISDSSISLITGKYYSVSALGYSSKGVQYPCDLSIFSFQAVATTLFPTLASYQDNKNLQKQIMRKVVSVVAYVLFPMMIGLFVVSKSFIIFLLTEKWLLSVPFMKIACVYYCATPLMLINVQLFHSIGNGRARLLFETVKLILTLGVIFVGVFLLDLSLQTIFIIRTGIEILIALMSIVGLKKAINYTVKEYLFDLLAPMLQTVIMILAVTYIGSILSVSITVVLIIQIFTGIVVYLLLSILIKPNGFLEIKKVLFV